MRIRKIQMIYIVLFLLAIATLASGCFPRLPMYQSSRSEGEEWYVDVNGNNYVLWPDKNWEMLLERGKTIGNWDDRRTSLGVFEGDEPMRYLSIGEFGADALHVPLVRQDLIQEFSLERIDLIKWLEWGIYTGNSQVILEYIIDDEQKVRRFIELTFNREKEIGDEDWIRIGSLYCYNKKLPGVEYVYKAKYFNGILKFSGYHTSDYILIPLDEIEEILGHEIDLEKLLTEE